MFQPKAHKYSKEFFSSFTPKTSCSYARTALTYSYRCCVRLLRTAPASTANASAFLEVDGETRWIENGVEKDTRSNTMVAT